MMDKAIFPVAKSSA